MRKVRMKVHVDTGFVNCDYEDEFIMEVDSNLSDAEVSNIAEREAYEFMHNQIDHWAEWEDVD